MKRSKSVEQINWCDRKSWWISLSILSILLFLLFYLKRTPFCECGEFLFWVADPNSSHTSQHLFDPYSFSHFQHGLVFVFILGLFSKARIEWAILLESLWEFAENTPLVIDRYRNATAALGYTGDSITNSMFDVLSCGIGFWFAAKLPWKYSLGLYLFIELFMLFLYKDSLILNVIMLVCPIEAIKTWQLGT